VQTTGWQKTRKTTQDGAAGQRREGARGRTGEKQNEQKRALHTNRPRPDFRGSTTTPRSSTTHCYYCYGERRSVPTPEKSPRSPPCAFASPWHNRSFSPSCPRQYNRTSFLRLRLGYELTLHTQMRFLRADTPLSDWTAH
jgi:hypothetical protein